MVLIVQIHYFFKRCLSEIKDRIKNGFVVHKH